VPVPIPQRERGQPAAQPVLTALHEGLWDSIKTEARLADREMTDA